MPNVDIMQQSSRPEVRLALRNPVRAHAFVHARGGFHPATVVDYSHGGLQLEGTFGLFRCDSVQIELISGIRVPGQVACRWEAGPG
jgi:PilZ domain